MKRTTISLPDDLAQALGREARRRHASASEITGEALQAHPGLAAALEVDVFARQRLARLELARAGRQEAHPERDYLPADQAAGAPTAAARGSEGSQDGSPLGD